MASMFDNEKKTLTMLKKSIERLARQNYYDRKQWPEIMISIEALLIETRQWLDNYELFANMCLFYRILSDIIVQLNILIDQLWDMCKPKKGKKQISKKRREQEQKNIFKSIQSMLGRLTEFVKTSTENNNDISIALEDGLKEAFKKKVIQKVSKLVKNMVNSRGEKSIIFPWNDPESYQSLVRDKKSFRIEVLDKFSGLFNSKGHKTSCKCQGEYVLYGFRSNSRHTKMIGGKTGKFKIRMIQCTDCRQKFSLLPSFLPREKHFGIDIIGAVCQAMCLFAQSIQGALENLKLLGKNAVKSRQTILNWIRWMGTHHPATILTRAGTKGSGYLQEDEGFEKEPDLRTYSVIMVDPENLLVWHADYLDHVDDATLCESFTDFCERISFKIFGLTKDKWKASTNALKQVFYGVWIGYCHRHCLKNFRKALDDYQHDTQCSTKEVHRLHQIFRKILKTSTSKANLEAKLRGINEDAFDHPALKARLKELKENATHYTSNKKRKGIRPTTSLVDNYLKQVKRKLNQVESFRDQKWASLFFRAQANTRNFLPFGPGAVNAKKSPFMLAGGQTYGLPWIQVMNVHDAFLFTNGAL